MPRPQRQPLGTTWRTRRFRPTGRDAINDRPLHAVVAHPVSPEPLLITRKRLPAHARIFETGNLLLHVVEDLPLPSPVELPQLALSRRSDVNRPGQAPVVRRLWACVARRAPVPTAPADSPHDPRGRRRSPVSRSSSCCDRFRWLIASVVGSSRTAIICTSCFTCITADSAMSTGATGALSRTTWRASTYLSRIAHQVGRGG